MDPWLGREEGVLNGHKHTDTGSNEVRYSGIDAGVAEVAHRCSFNSLVALYGKLLSSGSFQYGLSHILFICHKHLFAITILKHRTIAASFPGVDWDTLAELLSHHA